MSERFKPREVYRMQREGKIPKGLPIHHRSFTDAVANAEREKRIKRGVVMICRAHNLPWTECATCSPATKPR